MEIVGRLKMIGNTESVGANALQKRSFVISVETQYPYEIAFDLLKEKTTVIDQFQVGQNIKVSFDVRSREYNGKWYTNASAWRVEHADAGAQASAPQYNAQPNYAQPAPAPAPTNAGQYGAPAPGMTAPAEDDDLPF